MARKKTVTVYEVLFMADAEGPAGDGSHIRRFTDETEAKTFAAGKRCYSGKAEAKATEAPLATARRWGLA